jgi:hypothetical protein
MYKFVAGGIIAGVVVVGGLIAGLSGISHMEVGYCRYRETHGRSRLQRFTQGVHWVGLGSIRSGVSYLHASSGCKNKAWQVGRQR